LDTRISFSDNLSRPILWIELVVLRFNTCLITFCHLEALPRM